MENPLYPAQVTIFCALLSVGENGSYFVENCCETIDTNHLQRNGRFTADILLDIIAAIEDYESDDMWFELSVATVHTASLHENFPERHISRFSNANWMHKSLDLTTFDFLWEYIKEGDTALFHLTPANILYVI